MRSIPRRDAVAALTGVASVAALRFAGFGPGEARRIAVAAGLDPSRVVGTVFDERLFGVRPYALITLHP